MTRRSASLRFWLLLLVPLAALLALNVGLLTSYLLTRDWPIWPLLLGLGVVVLGFVRLALALLQRLESNPTSRVVVWWGELDLDGQGRLVDLNEAAASTLGRPAHSLIGQPCRDLFVTSDHPALDLAARTGNAVELGILTPDNRSKWVCLMLAPAGAPTRALILDITARRLSEQRLTEAARHLQVVLDAATELAVVATDLDGRISLFNVGATRLLGFDEHEMVGRELPWCYHLRDEVLLVAERLSVQAGRPLRGFDALVGNAREGGHDEADWCNIRKDGRTVKVRTVVTGVRTSEGVLTGYLFLSQDQTERQRARERLAMTMEAARIGTWDWDLQQGRAQWSDNVPGLLGLPARTEATLEAWRGAIHNDDRDTVELALGKSLADPSAERHRANYRVRVGGEVRWVEDAGRILRDGQGRATRRIGTVMDITERVRAARALEVARDEAQRANDAKSFFLAAMSHEIRTPLSGVIGLAAALARSSLDESQRMQVTMLTRTAEGLLALINDILDLSKVEAGKLELEQIPFPLLGPVDETMAVLTSAAEEKSIVLRREVGAGLPHSVRGDPGRLRQVLINLMSNAVKFTDKGEVVIRLEIEEPGSIRFRVRDTGVGIPAEKLSRIFEPFTQADRSTTRTHGGTGLGLAIASRLVERMGGNLSVQSRPGEGSEFSFRLPLPGTVDATPVDATPEETVVQRIGRPLHVLIAEDNAVNQMVLTMLLTHLGCTHEVVGDGHEAVIKVQQGKYDLVLMDVQMPEVDGLRATRLIRQAQSTGRRLPIVACTANALEGERERCLQAGMDDYLTKPIRHRELLDTIARLFRSDRASQTPSRTPDPEDWRERLTAMGFDALGIAGLVRTLRESATGRLSALRQALLRGDTAQAKTAAHTLKGSLTVFGAREAIAAAVEVERTAGSEDGPGSILALERLEREVSQLLTRLG